MFPRAVYNLTGLPVKYTSNFDKMFYSFQRSYTYFKTNLVLKGYTKYRRNFIRHSSTTSLINLKQHKLFTKEEEKELMQYFPTIVRDITAIERESGIDDKLKRLAKVLEYNATNGSKVLGLLTVLACKMLVRPQDLTEENIKLANILAWCCELQSTSFIMLDDIMDNSETRRNLPCWYRLPNVGLSAINDAILIGQGLFILLKKYLSAHSHYISMVELMNEMCFKAAFGISVESEKLNLEDITMERLIVTDRYTFVAQGITTPITLGLYLSGVYTEELISQCKDVILEMGHFIANQNDMFDVFADPSTTGKIGTDIQEGKCTWVSVRALEKANPQQRKIMEAHFGKRDPKSVKLIVDLYKELKIPEEFFEHKVKSYLKVCNGIEDISNGPLRELFLVLSRKLYTPDLKNI